MGGPLGGAYRLQGQGVPEVRDSVSEWVAVEKAISREAVAWREKKALLADLTALAQGELRSLRTAMERAAETASEADEKRAELVAEEKAFAAASVRVRSFLDRIEPQVAKLQQRLPKPLLNDLESAFRRFAPSSTAVGDRVGERLQALVQILDGAQKFDRMLTVSEDVWELPDGTSGAVRVVYLGLGAAYYVSEANADSGIGQPGENGWTWVSRPEIRDQVGQVIESLEQRGVEAKFVPLPFQLSTQEP